MNEHENKNNGNTIDQISGSAQGSRDVAQARIDEMLKEIKQTAAVRADSPAEKKVERVPQQQRPISVPPIPTHATEPAAKQAPVAKKNENGTYLDTYAPIDVKTAAAADPVAEKQKKIKTLLWSAAGVLCIVILGTALYFLWDNNGSLSTSKGTDIAVTAFLPGNVFSPAVQPNVSEDVVFPEGIQEKFKAAYAAEQNFVGRLRVPNTSIDMPIYYSKDNNDYLKHDLWGKFSDFGVVFMDKNNSVREMSRNTVLYGHNYDTTADEKFTDLQFGEIEQYRDLEFYKQNPVIEFNTLYKDYKWKVIGCFVTNGDYAGDKDGDENYLFAYNWTNMNDESFLKLVDEIEQRSFVLTGVDVQPTDKILTLSTCTYFFDRGGKLQNARCALVARMVREGESEDVDVSKAVKNDNIRFPQLYYDIFGGTNPYRDVEKWYPVG